MIRIWNQAVVYSMLFEVVGSEVHGDNLDNTEVMRPLVTGSKWAATFIVMLFH